MLGRSGNECIVDDHVYEFISSTKWHVHTKAGKKYAVTRKYFDGKKSIVLMHRIIAMAPEKIEVDHINGNTLDNRIENLRLCNRAQNTQNSLIRIGKYGYRGVRKSGQKWRAVFGGKAIGYFQDIKQAARAYDQACEKRFGEFANTNKKLGLL